MNEESRGGQAVEVLLGHGLSSSGERLRLLDPYRDV
jgi:hypothetical protein